MRRQLRLASLAAALLTVAGPGLSQSGGQVRSAAAVAPLEDAPRLLVLSDQARRFLALEYRAFPTEFMGCMIGTVRGEVVMVERIAPADVDPAQSTATWVVPQQSCEGSGWAGTIGTIHSHPSAERCWYFFPGTQVPSADGQSFMMAGYSVDAIMCGDRVVWINRALVQRELELSPPRSPG
jgi:hypothetical protein